MQISRQAQHFVLSDAHSHSHSHSPTLTLTHSLTHSHTHTLTLALSHSHTHTLTLSHSHSHSHSLTHSFTHSLTLTHTHTHTHTHSLTYSLTHFSLSLSLSLSLSHSLTHSLTHSLLTLSLSLSLTLTHSHPHSLTTTITTISTFLTTLDLTHRVWGLLPEYFWGGVVSQLNISSWLQGVVPPSLFPKGNRLLEADGFGCLQHSFHHSALPWEFQERRVCFCSWTQKRRSHDLDFPVKTVLDSQVSALACIFSSPKNTSESFGRILNTFPLTCQWWQWSLSWNFTHGFFE